jgi:hypothetical protein
MRRRQIVGLSVTACALAGAAAFLYHGWHRAHDAAQSSNLVGYLPADNASVIYIDVDALRRSGILGQLAGTKAAEDGDYRQFMEATRFDYSRDLDAVAAAIKDGRIYFALRGRFHWSNLASYAVHEGGECHENFCVAPGSQPNRRISFYLVKWDVLAMAVGPDDFGAYQITAKAAKAVIAQPNEPVWAVIPGAALQSATALPAAAQALVPALQGADQIVLGMGANPNRQLQLSVHVTCKDAAGATALQAQLESATKSLRDAVARQHQKPDPSDLTGLLVAGNYRRTERQVYGTWAIPKDFVSAIAGNVY